MILSEQKPFEEIVAYLEKDKSVFIRLQWLRPVIGQRRPQTGSRDEEKA
jgi:hypothetical protein